MTTPNASRVPPLGKSASSGAAQEPKTEQGEKNLKTLGAEIGRRIYDSLISSLPQGRETFAEQVGEIVNSHPGLASVAQGQAGGAGEPR